MYVYSFKIPKKLCGRTGSFAMTMWVKQPVMAAVDFQGSPAPGSFSLPRHRCLICKAEISGTWTVKLRRNQECW